MNQHQTTPGTLPSDEASRHFTPLIQPDLAGLYSRRAARLRTLADGHDLADYLRLAARVAEVQASLVPEAAGSGPADARAIPQEGHWGALLDRLIERLAHDVPAPVAPHLAALRALPADARLGAAQALTDGRFDAVPAAIAPFFWAALSLQCASAARAAPVPDGGPAEHASCPVCGTAPVASLILIGDRQGMRYLHCALCESQWHMVRAKCTNCGDASELDYLSFDTPEATVRAESCGVCHGYLKVISLERDPQAEAVADDLATLALDDAVTAEGYQRTGFNPFALPG
ncbi:formate dehydrogenase accessory protein FdhE [Cupriavidus necator]|uniref:Protein FdhE homolog n=1 Tax=Cupriavidus necator TaxID=106590 RepID=A0A367PQF4_CUPNE|nr:formate dehydrogenase accessory protein FdhE [Cupriavidus necator]QQX88716.1 formate dehydrogenase accessory protein FdhE [Cupriavidus necator]RCJ09784.1 formate dehydrogenase accessory protein FdhE [Cupriavidus necator]